MDEVVAFPAFSVEGAIQFVCEKLTGTEAITQNISSNTEINCFFMDVDFG